MLLLGNERSPDRRRTEFSASSRCERMNPFAEWVSRFLNVLIVFGDVTKSIHADMIPSTLLFSRRLGILFQHHERGKHRSSQKTNFIAFIIQLPETDGVSTNDNGL